VKGRLIFEVQRAKEAYSLIKAGVIDGLSIGYIAIQKEMKDGVRHIKEARLFEGSIVTFPMNMDARISAVKSMGDGVSDFGEQLDAQQTACSGYRILNILQECLSQVWYNAGYDPDGDLAQDMPSYLAYAESVFDEAKEQYLAALAKYGNMSADCEDPDMAKSLRLKAKAEFLGARIEHKGAAITKRVAGEDLPASAFLIVGDPKTTSTWKLPVHFSTPEKSKAHIRNALARIDQVIGVPAPDLAKAKAKLLALAKENGIDADTGKSIEIVPEAKAGKKISAETAEMLRTAHGHMKSAGDILGALYSDDDSGTPDDSDDDAAADPDTDEPDDIESDDKSHSTGLSDVLEQFSRLVKTTAAAA
jgi:Caudovirus prohead serine protease